MSFNFTVWEDTEWFGDPKSISEIFSRCVDSLEKHSVWLEMTRDQEIDFKVIDVRQRREPSRSSPNITEKFIAAVNELLISEEIPKRFRKHTRFLFVGSSGLAKWESESRGDTRSIKKDIEFIIRTLQSYRLAHYVYVDGLTEPQNDTEGPPISKDLVVSALLSFARRHAHESSADAITTLQELHTDIARSLSTIRELPEFKTLGQLESSEDSSKVRLDLLLNEVRLLFQFGKRNRDSPWSPRALIGKSAANATTFEIKLPDSSYDLGTLLSTQTAAWAKHAHLNGKNYESRDSKSAQKLAAILYKVRRYELLRDFGRVIGGATLPTLREMRPSKKILIIDDWDYQKQAEFEPLGKFLKLVGWYDDCLMTESRFIRCDGDPLDSDQYVTLFDQTVPFRRLSGGDPVNDAPKRPEEYDVIIMDPEAVSDQYGPERLERLANYLKEVSRDKEDGRRKIAKERIKEAPSINREVPHIIAYSQRESSSNVQQCLNLGAWAFVTKGRCLRLLFEISRAVKIMKKRHRNDTSQASHFRILNSLKPSAVSDLQRADGTTYIYGGVYPDLQNYTTSHSSIDDFREHDWIRELPKADLHCHIGTAISFPTIRLLALNTVGYMLDAKRGVPSSEENPNTGENEGFFPTGAEDLIVRVTRAVVLAETLLASISPRPSELSPMVVLAAAAAGVTSAPNLKYASFGLGDIVIAAILKPNDRAQEFQVAALLVSAIELLGESMRKNGAVREEAAPTEVAEYLSSIAKRCDGSTPVHRVIPLGNRIGFHAESAWKLAMEKAKAQLIQASGRWDGYYTSDTIRTSFDDRVPRSDKFWKQLEVSYKERTRIATKTVGESLKGSSEMAQGGDERENSLVEGP